MGYRKLGRTSDKRRAMLRSLVTDLIIYGRIETTEMRAKEVKRIADKMVTLGKRGDLHARRQAASFVRNKVADDTTGQLAVAKLFDEVAPKYAERNGGYTRVLKTAPRRGDNASMAIIEFV